MMTLKKAVAIVAKTVAEKSLKREANNTSCSIIYQPNQMLGDGWILSCSQSNIIYIRNDDVNAWKYEMIWDASNQIRPFTIE